jgi:hypothetical protein
LHSYYSSSGLKLQHAGTYRIIQWNTYIELNVD